MQTLIDYLKQESTWRGLIQIAAAFGCVFSPEQAGAIIAAGLAAVGIINTFKRS